ncbi:hypothetical protein [Frankia sp. AvcI1]|uniref:hypothetical protein n=1 Tax=Frankia sp. AvcI1 TaxID=573496 RepID=UPI00211977C2|nr:hypothetical protein [Frankia sp. AvcI1]
MSRPRHRHRQRPAQGQRRRPTLLILIGVTGLIALSFAAGVESQQQTAPPSPQQGSATVPVRADSAVRCGERPPLVDLLATAVGRMAIPTAHGSPRPGGRS